MLPEETQDSALRECVSMSFTNDANVEYMLTQFEGKSEVCLTACPGASGEVDGIILDRKTAATIMEALKNFVATGKLVNTFASN